MAAPVETELKLRLDAEHAARLWRHPYLKSVADGRPVRRLLLSIYYDTPDLELMRQGVALRVRRSAGRWIQTVKTGGEERGGLHQRPEWEAELPEGRPDTALIAEPELRELIEGKPLQEAFVTEFRRTSWQLHPAEGSHIELALDRGSIKAGDATVPLCEIELELKSGEPERLYEVALALLDRIPMHVESASKAERGYRLLQPHTPRAHKAGAAGLSAELSAEQGFERILCSCIAHLQCNEVAVLQGEDKEGIHQMRVGLRRLRAVLKAFRPLIPSAASAALREEIKWLDDALGGARDWDVLVNDTVLPLMLNCAPDPVLNDLRGTAQRLAGQCYADARATLESSRYTRLLLDLGSWLVRRAWRELAPGDALESSLEKLAPEILEPQHRKLLKLGDSLADLSPEQRHQMRIRVKKLRYAGEYLGEIFTPRRTRKYLRRLVSLQDALGALNDMVVAEHLLEQAGLAQDPALLLVRGWHACKAQAQLALLPERWKAFARCKPFWNT